MEVSLKTGEILQEAILFPQFELCLLIILKNVAAFVIDTIQKQILTFHPSS